MKRLLLLLCALLAIGGCGGCGGCAGTTPNAVHAPVGTASSLHLTASHQDVGHRGDQVADFELDFPFLRRAAREHKKLERPATLAKDSKWVPWIRYSKDFSQNEVQGLLEQIEEANDGGASALLLEFDSPGGDVGAGWDVMRAIEHSKVPVHCLVDGEAASMAFLTLQSCKDRMMTKRSVLMAHEIGLYGQMGGNPNNWEAISQMIKARQAAILEQYVRKMKCTAEEMQRRIEGGKQWWMNWREAHDRRAIDYVVDSAEAAQEAYAKGQKPKDLAK